MATKPAKSAANSGSFAKGADPRRGRGATKGAPNAGRPPSAIRESYRMAAADRLKFLTDVIDGECLVKVRDADGNETGATISAPITDRLRAWENLNKYGLGTTTAVVDKDGEDIAPPVVLLPPQQQP